MLREQRSLCRPRAPTQAVPGAGMVARSLSSSSSFRATGAIAGLGARPGWERGDSGMVSNSRKTRPAEVDDSISLI